MPLEQKVRLAADAAREFFKAGLYDTWGLAIYRAAKRFEVEQWLVAKELRRRYDIVKNRNKENRIIERLLRESSN